MAGLRLHIRVFTCPQTKDRPTIGIKYLPVGGNPKAISANLHYAADEQDFQDLSAERVNAAIISDCDGGRLDVTEGAMVNPK